jgi:protein-S-isoprenylcysteine O-methyltransferase Ste14
VTRIEPVNRAAATPRSVNRFHLVVQIAGMFVVFAVALFVPAGTVRWPAAWIFLILMFGFTIVASIWLLRYDPDLLAERMTGIGRADQESWDKILLAVTAIIFLAWLVVMPLDAVRYRWSHMPAWLQGLGAALLLISFCMFYAVSRENAFLSPAVRIQTERGHRVVSSGPYRYVRHPMYAGFILFVFGTALLLGSWYGVLVGLLLIGIVARRAVLEERLLREGLEGYAGYMQRVRYRLIPGVW